MPITVKRITVQHGKITRKFLLIDPPFPNLGDAITIGRVDYIVTKIADEKLYLRFAIEKGKLRQVFP